MKPKFGGGSKIRTYSSIGNRFTVCRASPTAPFLHVLIITLSRYAVNRYAYGRGECVLKATNDTCYAQQFS